MEQLVHENWGYEHKRSDFNKIFFEGPVSGFVGGVLLQMFAFPKKRIREFASII